MTELGELAWPDVPPDAVLAVPLGSCEQHGPHLPLDTDTRIAVALTAALAAREPGVLVAPAVGIGASGEHGGFPGTLSIGVAVLGAMVVELVRSADAFAGVVLVNGHGGNEAALRAARRTLTGEGRKVLAWSPRGGDLHAGHAETSVLLALAPHLVRLHRAEAGDPRPLDELWPLLRKGGVAAVSPNGVLGDPTTAGADAGTALLDAWADDLTAAVRAWRAS